METLILLPVKERSKRLPRKNLRELNGRLMFRHVLYQALRFCSSVKPCSVVVSTESSEVEHLAKRSMVGIVKRPPWLAEDPATVIDVTLHALYQLERRGKPFDTVMVLMPNCPFTTAGDMKAAFGLYTANGAKWPVMSTVQISQPYNPYYSMMVVMSRLRPLWFANMEKLRDREFPVCWHFNGAIFICPVEMLKEERSFYINGTIPYEMPPERSIDVDTELDFRIAQCLMQSKP